jgi:hypothetical protein
MAWDSSGAPRIRADNADMARVVVLHHPARADGIGALLEVGRLTGCEVSSVTELLALDHVLIGMQ